MNVDGNAAKGNISHQLQNSPSSRRSKLAADFAYTLNHAIVCTVTDPLTDVPVGAAVQNIMANIRGDREKVSLRDVADGLRPREVASSVKGTFTNRQGLKNWLSGEIAGDFGAIPLVLGVQYYAPAVVNGIRRVVEPLASPFMRRAAERTVRKEFELAGEGADTGAYEARVSEVLEREIEKLPNAILWTVASPAINIAMQKLVMKSDAPAVDLLAGKAIGSVFTSGLTVGLRNASPVRAQQWDDWMGGKAEKPVASVISKVFGVDKQELVKDMKAREDSHHHGSPETKWQSRVESGKNMPTTEPLSRG